MSFVYLPSEGREDRVYKNTGFTTSVITIFVTAGGILAVVFKSKSVLITVSYFCFPNTFFLDFLSLCLELL